MGKKITRCCENCKYCLKEGSQLLCYNGNLADIFINGARSVSSNDVCESFDASKCVLDWLFKEKVR